MDYQRYLLIGAIAVLAYLLLLQWGQFSAQHSAQQQVATSAIPVTAAVDDIPIPAATAPSPSGDLPTTDTPAVALPDSDLLLNVRTDVLDVAIHLIGGDIIYAALPQFFATIDRPDQPFVLLDQSQMREYIAQSGLIGANGTDTNEARPRYHSTHTQYQLAAGDDQLVVDLHYQTDEGVSIIKRFTFTRGSYLIAIDYLIDNRGTNPWSAGLFGQIKRDNSPDPSAENSSFMGLTPYLGGATTQVNEPYRKLAFKKFADNNYQYTMQGGWIAMVQHYFLSAWIPDPDTNNRFTTTLTRSGEYIVRFTTPIMRVDPNKQGEIHSSFYVGPKDQYSLEKISPGLELSVDYGWLWWIAQPLFWVLDQIYKIVGNWGVAIIGITMLVKLVFFHLNTKAYRSMANMRKMQPKLAALRERYADDKQKQSQEMMALYKREKINPLGGCLPILVQMPVFIALYWVLMESVELRHAPFILWIHDLSAMDPYFILPLLMGASMFIQQRLNPAPPDPMQAKIMQWMPVVFTFFFLFFPAGLVLYWLVNNILSIAQQYVITRRIERGK
jgi:YidC/Oxa1 family membrane protein insertase